jgi:tetratricopeptide (TPR) repeat protein
MKKTILIAVLAALVVTVCASPALAASVRVIGKVTDTQGKPIPDAHVVFENPENGQKYDNKTNSKGEYDRIGFNPGNYTVTITDKDKKTLLQMKNVVVSFDKDPNEINFDFAKIAQQPAAAGGAGLTPEQQKQIEEAKNKNAEIAKENLRRADLNAKLRQADALEKAGDAAPDPAAKMQNYSQAVDLLKSVTQVDPSREIIWANLANAYLTVADAAAKMQPPDKENATENNAAAADAYKKAIQLNPQAKDIGGYHNNLGQALVRTGNTEEAIKEYNTAAQLDPTHAAQYYFNAGAVLTNQGAFDVDQAKKKQELESAVQFFDKATQVKPDYAEAYYQKGVNLVNQMTYDPKTNKPIPVPGTVESFNKYLELDPNGKYANDAKTNIQFFGGTVETKYKASKKK